MSKDEFVALIDQSFDNGTPFIDVLQFYSYALIPKGGGKWLEVSFDFEEKVIMENNEINDTTAFNRLCEEVEKAMSDETEDFMLVTWKEFKGKLSGSDGEKITAGIKELVSNAASYSKNLPIVLNKDDLAKVKSKL
jgi:hypothetical protein